MCCLLAHQLDLFLTRCKLPALLLLDIDEDLGAVLAEVVPQLVVAADLAGHDVPPRGEVLVLVALPLDGTRCPSLGHRGIQDLRGSGRRRRRWRRRWRC